MSIVLPGVSPLVLPGVSPCITLPVVEEIGNSMNEIISHRREVDENINNLLQRAAAIEGTMAIEGNDNSSAFRREAEDLANAERKKIVDAVGKNDLLDQPSEALLKLLLLKVENDEYDYEYIYSIGLQLSKISSDLLEIAFNKKGVPAKTHKSLKQKVVIVLKEIFSRC